MTFLSHASLISLSYLSHISLISPSYLPHISLSVIPYLSALRLANVLDEVVELLADPRRQHLVRRLQQVRHGHFRCFFFVSSLPRSIRVRSRRRTHRWIRRETLFPTSSPTQRTKPSALASRHRLPAHFHARPISVLGTVAQFTKENEENLVGFRRGFARSAQQRRRRPKSAFVSATFRRRRTRKRPAAVNEVPTNDQHSLFWRISLQI